MAALQFQVSVQEGSFTSTAKTAYTVTAPTNQRVKLKGLRVFGKGTSNTDTPVKIEIMTYASITGGTAGTVVTSKTDGDWSETIQSVIAGNYTAEPTYTTGVTVDVWEVHPQTGIVVFWPLHDELVAKGGTGFAVRVTTNQAETLSITGTFEE